MNQPHIIFIFSDQHNPEYMGMNPDSIVRTPHLDRLAADGVNMTNCYCPSPVCVASRSSLLTSTYPQDTGTFLNDNCMPSDWPTVAHSLGAVGYETVLCGRMHFIGADQRHGFEKRFIGDFTWQYPGGREQNHQYWWDGDDADLTYGPNRKSVSRSGGGNSAVLEYDNAVRDEALDFINKRTDERPLFLTVGFYGPHNPFVGPKEYFDYYYDKVEVPEITDELRAKMHPTSKTQMKILGLDDLTGEEVRRSTAAYCSMVQKMDDDIGKIIECVEKNLEMENTIIIYASDHGEMMGAKGLYYKFVMYEGSANVPMMFRWDGHFKAGREIKNLTNIIDITPTLIDIAGGTQLPLTRGISLYDNLREGTEVDAERTTCSQIIWNKLLFSGKQFVIGNVETNYATKESFGADNPEDGLMAMIRWHQYKLIMHGFRDDRDYELYDIEQDPREDEDLSKNVEYQEICDRMAAELLNVWNPEAALEKVTRDKAGLNIMQRWFETYDRNLKEELWLPESKPVNTLALKP